MAYKFKIMVEKIERRVIDIEGEDLDSAIEASLSLMRFEQAPIMTGRDGLQMRYVSTISYEKKKK